MAAPAPTRSRRCARRSLNGRVHCTLIPIFCTNDTPQKPNDFNASRDPFAHDECSPRNCCFIETFVISSSALSFQPSPFALFAANNASQSDETHSPGGRQRYCGSTRRKKNERASQTKLSRETQRLYDSPTTDDALPITCDVAVRDTSVVNV